MTNTKLYIGNLSKATTSDSLKAQFIQFGDISEILLPLDKKSKEVKGYAFITFKDAASAQEALSQDATVFSDQKINVQIATDKPRGKKKKS